MSRLITFQGEASSNTFLVQHSPAEYETLLSNDFLQNGYGLANLHITVGWSAVPTAYNYLFTISFVSNENESVERVKQIIVQMFAIEGLTMNSINLSGDTGSGAQFIPDDSIAHSLFGTSSNTAATIFGFSTGTALAIGIGVLALFMLKSPTSPVRYLRR